MAFSFPRAAGSVRSLLAAPFAVVVALSTLSACAATAEPAVRAVELRVLVKLVRPSQDTAAIAAEATRQAGVPASYAASVSAAWHSLNLRCVDAAACEAAVARLRQASTVYEAVELDGRKQRAVM